MPLAEKIEHVIVLMLENRSFDHLLGGVEGVSDLTLQESNPDPTGLEHPVAPTATYDLPVGPGHSHLDILAQLHNGNRGFVENYHAKLLEHGQPTQHQDRVMRYFQEDRVPVLSTLAREFVTIRRWFSSVPGATWPNRNYAHAATSDGEVNIKVRAYWNDTIFQLLDHHQRSWRIYHQGPAQSWAFPKLWLRFWRHRFKNTSRLLHAIDHDALDNYSFVEPDHGLLPWRRHTSNNQHPDNNTRTQEQGRDFKAGEQLIADIYKKLCDNPQVFAKTLLLITYDEHGGFHDHVVPPAATPPGDLDWREGQDHFGFDSLGVRVPAILISPWLEPAVIDEGDWDHASIVSSLRGIFAPMAEPLNPRDGNAPGFDGLPVRQTPRVELPDVYPNALVPMKLHVAALNALPPDNESVTATFDEFQLSLASLTGVVEEVLNSEEAGLQGMNDGEDFPEVADPIGRFATRGAMSEYVEYVTRRFGEAIDPQIAELYRADGTIVHNPEGGEIRAAIHALFDRDDAEGSSVSLMTSRDLLVRLAQDGVVRRIDLETGVMHPADDALFAVELDAGDPVDRLVERMLRMIGREPLNMGEPEGMA